MCRVCSPHTRVGVGGGLAVVTHGVGLEILKKFNYTDVKSASTLVDLEKPLVKDGDADDVDVHLYRSMIGSLMYLTTSRPDIMFAVCACARFQVTPKTSHLLAVKRIFRYLKGKPTLGLWYSRDLLFELVAYTDSDYAGATQDRKSTTGGCQFLGNRLISWQCKKQTMVATSTTEAEYVAGIFLQKVLMLEGEATYVSIQSKHGWKDMLYQKCVKKNQKHLGMSKEVGTPRYLSLVVPLKKVSDEAVHKELGDRMERAATTASSLEIEQDSGSGPRCQDTILGGVDAQTSTSENEKIEITATIDGTVKTIIEASTRTHLKLEDVDGISSLPNTKIFEQLALMGYASDSDKPTFQKGMLKNLDSRSKFLMYPRFIQIFLNKHKRHLLPHKRTYVAPTLTQKLFSNMRRVSKGYSGVNIPLFPTMLTAPESSPSRITSSPSLSPLTHPSTSQQPPTPPFMQHIHDEEEPATLPHDSSQLRVQSLGSDEGSLTLNELTVLYTTLSKKVEDLQNDLKQTKLTYGAAYTKLILRVKKLEHRVKASKSRRRTKIVVSDDEEVSEDPSKQGRIIAEIDQNSSISLILLDQEEPTELVEDPGSGEKGEKEISTASAILVVSTAIPERQVYIRMSAEKRKDKGKAIMEDDESVQKNTKKQLEQERLRHEDAIRLQEQIDEEERQRIARDAEIAKQLQDEIDIARQEQKKYDLAQALKLQKELDKRKENVAETTQAHDIDWSDPAGGYKQSYFRGMSYEDIRPIFERVWDQNQAFVPKDSEMEKEVMKRPRFNLQQKQSAEEEKLQKNDDSSNPSGGSRKKTLAMKRASEKQIEEGEEFAMDVESLSTKYPIVDWKTHILTEIFILVKQRYVTTSPEGYDLMLWRDLKTLFEPNEEDEVCRNQHGYNLISWRLIDSCGIHILLMDNGIAIHMMVKKKYPLIQEVLSKMLNRKLEIDHESEMAFELLRFIRLQLQK
ncbi:hypothetical protein Tco_0504620 [Tanacetum coccineum]